MRYVKAVPARLARLFRDTLNFQRRYAGTEIAIDVFREFNSQHG